MSNLKNYERFEKLYQVISWIGTILLLLIIVLTRNSIPSPTPLLSFLSALLGITSLLFVTLLPLKGEGFLKYAPEDKVVVESLVMILILTAFLYFKPLTSSGFFILLIPVLLASSVLHEKIILAEAAFATMAVIFLSAASRGLVFYFSWDFFVETGVFVAVTALLYALTRQLRMAGERNEELSSSLSKRLDQIQVISVLVAQSENFQRFDFLLNRVGEIVSDAFDAEQCGFFLINSDGELQLQDASVGYEESDRSIYKLEQNMRTPLSVFEKGNALLINNEEDAKKEGISGLIGDRHMKNFIMSPLGVKDSRIGVIMVANKRGESFDTSDLHFLQLLAGFISTLVDSAGAFLRIEEERKSAEKLTKLLVGRELKMKELKKQLDERGL